VAKQSEIAETVVVAGGLAQKIEYAGHAWLFLQYLLGFKRLGFEVLFVDRLSPEMHFGPGEGLLRAQRLARLLEAFGLDHSLTFVDSAGIETVGLERADVLERIRRSRLLLNVNGYLEDEELLDAARLRVFLDIDPGFSQMWHALGLADVFGDHDVYLTIAENIGKPSCSIPTCGLDWRTTRQPVVLEQWPAQVEPGGNVTTVGCWRGPYDRIQYEGRTYGLRVHEFRKFADLPRLTGLAFEAALDMDAADNDDRELLAAGGWALVDPADVVANTASYRRYIQRSFAEVSIAKQMMYETSSGWVSDRTCCYLASGRPVLARDSGLGELYPCGEGLLTFSTVDEAVEAVARVVREPRRHAAAARALAEEAFDSDRVLTKLMETAAP
jgi:glycosyltransferase involved in cell wall biosynthesis